MQLDFRPLARPAAVPGSGARHRPCPRPRRRPIAAATAALLGALLASRPAQARGPRVERELVVGDHRVKLDLSKQVLGLRVPERVAYQLHSGPAGAPAPTLAGLHLGKVVSAALLLEKARLFDEGLHAAVELAAQKGAGKLAGKEALLRGLLARLVPKEGPTPAGADETIALLVGAAELGQLHPQRPPALDRLVQARLLAFKRDPLRSRPVGFYTWSPELGVIFAQDRFLQTPIAPGPGLRTLVAALAAAPSLRNAYEQIVTLHARLTHPPVTPDLRPQLRGGAAKAGSAVATQGPAPAFLPPWLSHEASLGKRLYGDRPVPPGFRLADELITRIRAGKLDLKPTAASGFYDHVSWALEALVTPEKTPEAARLRLHRSYLAELEELFKGVLTQTRDTHVKQVEVPAAGGTLPQRSSLPVYPQLSAEPLPTLYLRRALAYRFLRRTLEQSFGAAALGKLRRISRSGEATTPLGTELKEMEGLFFGAYVTTMRELGLPPDPKLGPGQVGSGQGARADAARFARWAAAVSSDEDLKRDLRAMVPVYHDARRGKTRVTMMLGWSSVPVEISFAEKPAAQVRDARGKPAAAELDFRPIEVLLAYPVMAEADVTQVLNAEEFRRHCDRHRTQAAILKNLR